MNRLIWIILLLSALLAAPEVKAIEERATYLPAVDRIIAVGDLHGDLDATRNVFQLAGITDQTGHWAAGTLVVVQTGDQLDRGGQEQALLEFLDRLQDEAAQAGGALHLLNGNHELMNTRLDLRYVTEEGFADFEDAVSYAADDSLLASYEPSQRARVAAFRPGGPWAKMLSERNCVLVIGDNVFVHGGVLPRHLEIGLEQLNLEIRLWLAGEGPEPSNIHNSKSPTWSRLYSDQTTAEACATLAEVLAKIGAKRLIVGHTVQEEGIGPRCEDQVWCIDAGIAAYYGAGTAVLEIVGDQVKVLNP